MADTRVWTRCKQCGKWERRPPSARCGCGSRAKEPAAVSIAPPVVQATEPAYRTALREIFELARDWRWNHITDVDSIAAQTALEEIQARARRALEDSHG